MKFGKSKSWSKVAMWSVIGLCLPAAGQVPPSSPASAIADSATSRGYFKANVQDAEREIVPLVMRRSETKSGELTLTDLQLDMRILVRWVASLPTSSDDAAAVSYLRVRQLRAAATALDSHIATHRDEPLTKIQQTAVAQLHQLTYDLPAKPDSAKLDATCRAIGQYLLIFATGNATLPEIPPMRPGSLAPAPAEPAAGTNPAIDQPHPIPPQHTGPAQAIPQLGVSPALRQQLLRTLDMTQHPATYQLSDDDARQLAQMLDEAVDVAAGLASNAGVTPEARAGLEQQLTESLALFSDKRLRDLARNRISAMAKYRQVLSSITKLNLDQASYKALAPAFEYAQNTPAESKRVLAAVEKFVTQCAQLDGLTATMPSVAGNPTLTRALAKPYEDGRKRFEEARNVFVGAVEQMGGAGMGSTSADDLENELRDMAQCMDMITTIRSMPRTVETLNTFRPRPAGGLEKRIAKELAAATSPAKDANRQEASVFLHNLVRAANTAKELETLKISPADQTVFEAYTEKSADDLVTKWRANVTDTVCDAAAGNAMDAGKIDRNEMLKALVDSLSYVAAVEAQVQDKDALSRWADWGLDEKNLSQTLYPYRAAAATAFLSFLNDKTDGMKAWHKVRQDQRPTVTFVLRCVASARQVPSGREGLSLHCAKLMTPLFIGAFSTARFFTYGNALLAMPRIDTDTADAVKRSLEKRLANPQ